VERKVLVLTSWFFPYQILRWQDAVRLIYMESATVVSEYAETLCAPSVNRDCPSSLAKMPAVIRLKPDVEPKRKVKYSRMNAFVRDHFICQYCGKKKKVKELTADHLVPRQNGGKTGWTNIVTACGPCNLKKGGKTCDEAGMFPRNLPVRPKSLPLVSPVRDLERAPAEWRPFVVPYLPTYA
jgi:5-methylcytosine-specific restriction endonuclease McrA